MPRKCCVTGCTSNYTSSKEENVTVYRLPKDSEERERWFKAIPRDNIPDNKDTVVCAKHFPPNFPVVKVKGRERPRDPPSIFHNLPKSLIPTPPPAKRKTVASKSSVRSQKEDELSDFLEQDKIKSFENLCKFISAEKVGDDVCHYLFGNKLYIQSKDLEQNTGITKFCLIILNDLSFETYRAGVRCSVSSMVKNRLSRLGSWSQLTEILRSLKYLERNHKQTILLQQAQSLSNIHSTCKYTYSSEVMVRAFEYFARSRSLYNQLRNDFQLPSISTLTRMTSKVASCNDDKFLKSVFEKLERGQKTCILLIDEVYVKPMLTYHGGQLFGQAVNDGSNLAKTVLAFMVSCLYGGPTFFVKMLPVNKLDADFLYEQANLICDNIIEAGGNVKAIISDNNRVNQSFFRKFDCSSPWLTKNGMFLLFDFVHILKCIRNNWITEKTGQIKFYYQGETHTAEWSHIQKLERLEHGALVKLSKLTYVAANPKPIERQKVDTCLKVFCDETIDALKFHPGMQNDNVDGTVLFLTKVVQFWKIVNVKSPTEGIHWKDSVRDPISSLDDLRFHDLIKFCELFKAKYTDGKRVKCLTTDTSNALFQTCHGLVDLAKCLLNDSHCYVLLGKFTTDPIERAFGKLRQGSGGTYFINTQQVIEKWNISKTKLALKKDIDIIDSDIDAGHYCEKCLYTPTEAECDILNNLEKLMDKLPFEIKLSLIYIAGYVFRKDNDIESDTFYHYESYGTFTASLDRGGLKIPSDTFCEWCFMCYILFDFIDTSTICRYSLASFFVDIAFINGFDESIDRRHSTILANIFLNNYCHNQRVTSDKESKVKLLKLSS